ncbi:Mitogen-activated protein kinase kinase kinase [Trema orientale]|uniref:Mitogen-activated protein kinase kinase kinase n=1 Tax=Trema orientale TaxID=63057 RepID=A0A2P5DK33_TREOI|nr:Mitogen-activated protein kinase kinase kinase [Trema orientale]
MNIHRFIVFILLITVRFGGGQAPLQSYFPEDNIALDCGSQVINNPARDDRNWAGDINSKLFPLKLGQNNESIPSPAGVESFSEADPIPYGTARLSVSEFTYDIPVRPGPKFVRLHFYSAPYGDFNISKAFFSVKAGQYTLLSNFSIFLNAEALGRPDIVKEYWLNVEDSALMRITFTPSTSISRAFALVNGIEVVSMPADLYHSDPEHGLRFVGQLGFYPLGNDSALEMMYRINTGGGGPIPPASDTGMYRNWDDEKPYLTNRGFSVIPVETSAALNFSMIPRYTAPEAVYRTARTMGTEDRALIKGYNLTWEYPVDSGFYYMVRLHFCEIVPVMNSTGDRLFFIFIANLTAESNADVIRWSGGKYVPCVKDYVVSNMFSKNGEKKLNLSIALQANPKDWKSKYVDAILNGVEIFKINDNMGNLAGPNPDPPKLVPNAPSLRQQGDRKNSGRIIGIVAGVVSSLVILSILGFFVFRQARKVRDTASTKVVTGNHSLTMTKSSKGRGSSLPSDLCRYFSLAEIRVATKDFDDNFIIGFGGFGNVYKGYIDDGTTPVAIKRLKPESSQGANEFKTEIEMLSHLRHRHLVSLIGYCNDDREMILVYDYMARGTLRHHLYDGDNSPLSWKQRLEICIGAARGLQYLHTGAKHTIIHRDVKSTNILLDEKCVAKVSDFGLSKTGPTGISKAHVTTVVKGSVGYLDPEYYKRQQLTEKSDVYSFGVVLCEVLCARPPILRTAGKGKVSLAEWAPGCYRDGTLDQIIDPHLTGKIAPECLKKYGEIFVSCMLDNGTERPSMNDIVWGLEFAMQLQQSAEDNDRAGGATITPKDEDAIPFMNDNSDGTFTSSWEDTSESKSSGVTKFSSSDKGSTTNESIKGMSGAVFSEINNNAKGR